MVRVTAVADDVEATSQIGRWWLMVKKRFGATVFNMPQMGPHCLRLQSPVPRMRPMRRPPLILASRPTRALLQREALLSLRHHLCQLRRLTPCIQHDVSIFQSLIISWRALKAPKSESRTTPPPFHLKGSMP